MPAIGGNVYGYNETLIYSALIAEGLNTAAVCGILANLYKESGFNPINVQNSHGDKGKQVTYTAVADNPVPSRFITDGVGYGLAQWTYHTRKRDLYNFAKKKNTSVGDLSMQLLFMLTELKNSYKSKVYNVLSSVENTAEGAYQAAYTFCKEYEKPADPEAKAVERGNLAKTTIWNYYSNADNSIDTEPSAIVESAGEKIVKIARTTVGLMYRMNGNMYNYNYKGADDAGLVYYCFREVGFNIPECTTEQYYKRYIDREETRLVDKSNVQAADLLFYGKGSSIDYVAIATGANGRIYADISSLSIIEDKEGIGDPLYILRILETDYLGLSQLRKTTDSSSGGGEGAVIPADYVNISNYNPHSQTIARNLSVVDANYLNNNTSDNLGYLIDMTHGGTFTFYTPEFTENAGAQWNHIEIRGRSVNVISYTSTKSRTISLSLELYAGVGTYTPKTGETTLEEVVSRLHKDAYFLKSLEYPDYTNVITRPPSTVHLILNSAIDLVGVVSDVSIEHLKPVDSQNRSIYLKVSFTVTQTAENPPDWQDIRKESNSVVSTNHIESLESTTGDATNTPTYAGEGD